jgi:hypothetical protein
MTHPLETRLRGEGFGCRVEERDRLAILIPDEPSRALTRDERRRALHLAREEGFSHVAIELDPGVATLPGD